MNDIQKNAVYSLVLLIFFMSVYYYRSCEAENQSKNKTNSTEKVKENTVFHLQGVTMGVVKYNIKYIDKHKRNLQPEIDTMLKYFNESLSTYIPTSDISRFNALDKENEKFVWKSYHFYRVLFATKKIFEQSGGAFDPTVAPLVEAWGFGRKKRKEGFVLPDSNKILALKKLVGFDKIQFDENNVSKTNKDVNLDFGGIAGGYAVDIVTEILEKRGIHNYMVEIGGELLAKGKNPENQLWKLAITNPRYKLPNEKRIFAVIEVQDRAMNTSGNYENFYENKGKKYAHTINPQTGFPENNSLLSATIFAKDCMTADGYATACMVMGKEKSIAFLNKHKELGAYLIYANAEGKLETYITKDIKPFVKD